LAILDATESDFDEVIQSEKTVLVDFWAVWCPPCKRLSPILKELDEELEDFNVAKVNVDEHPELASRFGVMSMPTLIVFQDGQPVKKAVGFLHKEALTELIAR
jgi:thioredoxin 1